MDVEELRLLARMLEVAIKEEDVPVEMTTEVLLFLEDRIREKESQYKERFLVED